MDKDFYNIEFYWDGIDQEWIVDFQFQKNGDTVGVRCQAEDPIAALDCLADTVDAVLRDEVDVEYEDEGGEE